MTNDELLVDAFGRVREGVHRVVDGTPTATLTWQPEPAANSIGWLVWHLARVQDDHVATLAGTEQVWTSGGWEGRLGLGYPTEATGYGQGAEEVGRFSVASGDLLTGYLDAVHEATVRFLRTVEDDDLAGIVDRSWDPPVTLAVRLVSILADNLQHLGQAAYLKGLAERR